MGTHAQSGLTGRKTGHLTQDGLCWADSCFQARPGMGFTSAGHSLNNANSWALGGPIQCPIGLGYQHTTLGIKERALQPRVALSPRPQAELEAEGSCGNPQADGLSLWGPGQLSQPSLSRACRPERRGASWKWVCTVVAGIGVQRKSRGTPDPASPGLCPGCTPGSLPHPALADSGGQILPDARCRSPALLGTSLGLRTRLFAPHPASFPPG